MRYVFWDLETFSKVRLKESGAYIYAADDSTGWRANDGTGSASAPLDPVLGPLQDNGGPTPTHALLAGSPALRRGDPTVANSLDQRGSVRSRTTAGRRRRTPRCRAARRSTPGITPRPPA